MMAVRIDGGEPRQVFPGPEGFGKYQVVKPRPSPDGTRIAFISNRGGGTGWQTWVADLATGRATRAGTGCEPGWFPDGRRIFHVQESGMKGGTGIVMRDLPDGDPTPLQDGDEPRGHEYFPVVTRDGRWLLWSACLPGQHTQLDFESNYQIFARELPGGEPVRLTFDGWNNRWAKRIPAGP